MRALVALTLAAAFLAAGCTIEGPQGPAGPQGDAGPAGEAGPTGETGPLAPSVVWKDADGKIVRVVTTSGLGESITLFVADDAGFVWSTSPAAGIPKAIDVLTYYTAADCGGPGFIEPGIPARFIFTDGLARFVIADSDAATAKDTAVESVRVATTGKCSNAPRTAFVRPLPAAVTITIPPKLFAPPAHPVFL